MEHTDRLREVLNHLNAAIEALNTLLAEDTVTEPPAPSTPPVQETEVVESDRYSWFNIELRQRFSDVEEVPNNSVDTVFAAAESNRQWISDVIDITLDYHNTKSAVSKPVGFIISVLKRGNPEQAREQVRAIRKYQESSGNSLVDSALAEARKRIKEPAPEPTTSRLRQLKEQNG